MFIKIVDVFGKNNLVNVIYYGELIALLIINIVFIIDPCFLPPANCTFQQLEKQLRSALYHSKLKWNFASRWCLGSEKGFRSKLTGITEAYSESHQTSTMERFAKIVNGRKSQMFDRALNTPVAEIYCNILGHIS